MACITALPREFARRMECRQERPCGKFERLVFMSERMLSLHDRASHRAAHRLWLRADEIACEYFDGREVLTRRIEQAL